MADKICPMKFSSMYDLIHNGKAKYQDRDIFDCDHSCAWWNWETKECAMLSIAKSISHRCTLKKIFKL